MKIKTTKRALIASILSLVLCASMLIGTTFAWFTDSVTSGNNVIKSGNLDVNLYYWDNSMATGTQISIVDQPDVKLFKNVEGEEILWEPGATGFGQFEVANEGTLALKYQLKLEFYNATATADGKTLADVLSVYAVARNGKTGADDKMEDSTLEELRSAYMDSYVPGYEAQALTDFVLEGYLLPGESFIYELGAFWEPTANDNDYNVDGGLSIDFGVTLLATQMTYEEDSYDDQYDKDAEWIDVILAHGGVIDLEENYVERMTVSQNAVVELNLKNNALKNTLINKGEVAVDGGTIEIGATGFENYGEATLDGVIVNAGTPGTTAYGYAINAYEGSNTVLNDVQVKSANGAIGVTGGSELTLNDGYVEVDSKSTSGRYLFYIVDEGSVATINGGEFFFNKTQNQKRAYAYVGEGATLYITGGTFGTASSRSGYTAGLLGDGDIVITGGTFGFDPSTWVADGYKATKVNASWIVTPENLSPVAGADSLIEALENGKDVILMGDVKIDPANMSNAYGTTGINVKNGQTIDGQGNVLDIKGAGGTWDSGINTTGGTIKNLTVTGSFRGIFINHNSSHSEKVYLENVIIDGTTYTISCDQGTGNGLEATNSTFNGWTSYAATIGDVKFVDCSFGEGNGYAFCRPYASTAFVGCDFEAGFKMDPRAAVTFENCTIGGVALTAENLSTLVTSNIQNATVIG